MNRFLNLLNLTGVALLAALCALQWQTNRRLNLQSIATEQLTHDQADKIADQNRTIDGITQDLNEFRQRLLLAESQLNTTHDQLTAATAQRTRLAAERTQLQTALDQTKSALDQWIAAVTQRDQALHHANDQIQSLSHDRNAAVAKFNDLAAKYNAIVKQLDQARSSTKPASWHALLQQRILSAASQDRIDPASVG